MKKVLILCFFALLLNLTTSCFEIIDDDVKIVEEDATDFEFLYDHCGSANDPDYIAVKLLNSEKNYTYDVFCDHGFVGSINDEMQPLKLCNIKNTSSSDLFWIGWTPSINKAKDDYNFMTAYITIIKKEINHIVGYTVIETAQWQYANVLYYGEIITSKSFPKINDEYQFVSNSYIEEKIEEIKNEKIVKEEVEKPAFKYDTCYTTNLETYIAVNILDPDEKYTYSVSCYYGYISVENYNDFNISYNEIRNTSGKDSFWIGWRPLIDEYDEYNYFDKDFITIKQIENEHLVGFIVIEVTLIDEENLIYQGNVISSVSFPKIDEEYQYIRYSHVRDMVLEIIENRRK